MYADSLPSKPPSPIAPGKVKVEGAAQVRFVLNGTKTVLRDLYQRDPVRLLFPDNPPGELTIGVLTTTSGGLVGGDKINIDVVADPDTQAMIMAQAAEKIYRSTGADCLIDISIQAGDGAWFEWLPQETILHQGARMRRQTRLALNGAARVLAGEFLVFGRHAMGEKMTEGLVRDAWQVSIDGRAVWADAFHMEGELDKRIDHPAGLGGAIGLANAVYAGADAAGQLDWVRELLNSQANVRSAATLVNGVLLVRWLGKDVFSLRKAFAEVWMAFRHRVGGQPQKLSRLWHM
ncbi:MAG: urease accessory protein UreD [Rhodospirillales bacterium]|nr:urease accessory protein UreD [Rhodospirillales bacterium]